MTAASVFGVFIKETARGKGVLPRNV